MNVCILTHTFPKTPNDTTAAFLHALVGGLNISGIRPVVLTPFHKSLRADKFPYKVIPYRYIWPDFLHILGYGSTFTRGTDLPFVTYLLVPFLLLFGVIQLLNLVRKEKVNIIC